MTFRTSAALAGTIAMLAACTTTTGGTGGGTGTGTVGATGTGTVGGTGTGTGAGSTTPTPFDAQNLERSLGDPLRVVALDSSGLDFSYNNGSNIGADRQPCAESASFSMDLYCTTIEQIFVEYISGVGYVIAGRTNDVLTPNNFGATFFREATTTLPDTGTGQFSGSYHAVLQESATSNRTPLKLFGYISGDALVDVDFGARTFSGAISDRDHYDNTAGPLFDDGEDLVLPEVTIDDNGFFSGTTSGGRISSTSYLNVSGSFEGALAADDTVLGIVELLHQTGDPSFGAGPEYEEVGVFVARKGP